MKQYWRLFIRYKGRKGYAQEAKSMGCIAFHYCPYIREFERVKNISEGKGHSWRFAKGISIGDIVVVPDRESSKVLFAQVIGSCEVKDKWGDKLPFYWRRKVKWLHEVDKKKCSMRFRKGMNSSTNICRLNKYKNEIEELLSDISSAKYDLQSYDEDLKEQDEISEVLRKQKGNQKDKIINELEKLKLSDPEVTKFKGKSRKRDNKTIAQLKYLRDYKCQMCETQILKKDKTFYIEAAHITPKCEKGLEMPENILILCPNHHKEFDYGDRHIIDHNKNNIRFKLNKREYSISLALRAN